MLATPDIDIPTADSPSEDSKYTGVWVDAGHKIASIGVQVRHRVTSHGFALNVHDTALRGFQSVVACGLPDVRLTSLQEQWARRQRHATLSVQQVADLVARQFGATMQRSMVPASPDLVTYEPTTDAHGREVVGQVCVEHVPVPVGGGPA